MGGEHFDVAVIGSGPAGSVAALVLARGGARVALVDKARFPRDKACGDLVGPRGIQLLQDLGIEPGDGARRVDDMIVLGPAGRPVRLPCTEGDTYPGYGLALPRVHFDALLHEAAVAAGACPVVARVERVVAGSDGDGDGRAVLLSTGGEIRSDVVIGADGATSQVATAAGLVDPERVLWGFAVRSYLNDPVSVPHIVLWDEARRRGFPGYGWLFPGLDGQANVGLGLGVMAARGEGSRAVRQLAPFLQHLRTSGVLTGPLSPVRQLGGWLKMGMVGTVPARGRVLLVGDAAGLVNPLQGEGIAAAMGSARAAAEAVLAGPAQAADRYRAFLAETYAPYLNASVPLHRALLPHPRLVSAAGRALTAPGVGRLLSGGWAIFWNDLLAGARPSGGRRLAAAAQTTGTFLSARGRRSRVLDP